MRDRILVEKTNGLASGYGLSPLPVLLSPCRDLGDQSGKRHDERKDRHSSVAPSMKRSGPDEPPGSRAQISGDACPSPGLDAVWRQLLDPPPLLAQAPAAPRLPQRALDQVAR